MKLYSIADDTNVIVGWAGTQADAKREAKEQDASFTEFEVPTNKEDLLDFLNKYAIGVDAETGERASYAEEAAAEEEEEEETGEDEETDEDEEEDEEEADETGDDGEAEEADDKLTELEARIDSLEVDLANTKDQFEEAINTILARLDKPAAPAKKNLDDKIKTPAPIAKLTTTIKGGSARRAGR